ncbi:hypothetical protein FDP41_013263 [Naegleria fowleri]|uniref:Uncharacterized protein n=1 Tax=Naegleria fowleri TaxID=5763 RepID=A0A6A5C4I4_NAEFO|nr:uncharacterized protein FDP41_013263 [Naegleria fowleri]KAF0980780.1 hypothetical protein FDP41_013263 [Naegleria fowleri]
MNNGKQPLYTGQAQFVGQPQRPQYYVNNNSTTTTNSVTTPTTTPTMAANQEDANNAMLMFVIGFFFGIIWIVNYVMYRNSPNVRAQQYAKYSLYAFIASLVLSVGFFVLLIFLSAISAAF